MNTSASPHLNDTIVALATPAGTSAIAVIRVSGPNTFVVLDQLFKGKKLSQAAGNTIHFGSFTDGKNIIDEVLVSIFKKPKSFTKEDVAEISCHGSPFIIKTILQILVNNGCRLAKAGEFTQRAFLNGQFDLAQAEAIADLIASDTELAHRTALNQMRGGFSEEIKKLREKLIHFASMIELELDFSEEDVEFANRDQLKQLILEIKRVVERLISSFDLGHVIKHGVPTVIVGKPNAGKSTLLNTLLNEEKAIVSDIPGTTRDLIEDELILDGISYRFIDTAGLRETVDKIEAIGVERTRQKMKQASLIIYLFDVNTTSEKELIKDLEELKVLKIPYLVVGNKIDKNPERVSEFNNFDGIIYISAKKTEDIEVLKLKLLEIVNLSDFKAGNTIVTNLRHYESLSHTKDALQKALKGLEELTTGDFLAQDIRIALHSLGEITGSISNEDLLDNIFSKFCIGK